MSERPFPTVVALRDRASGRFLAAGPSWSEDPAEALLVDERAAADLVRRFVCEAGAVELVAPVDAGRAVA